MYINNDVFTGIDKLADVRAFLVETPIKYLPAPSFHG
jgi:hypothetical protein